MSLLNTTIEDLKNGNITIATKKVEVKPFYNAKGRKINKKTQIFHFAVHKDGSKYMISKKTLDEYKEVINSQEIIN